MSSQSYQNRAMERFDSFIAVLDNATEHLTLEDDFAVQYWEEMREDAQTNLMRLKAARSRLAVRSTEEMRIFEALINFSEETFSWTEDDVVARIEALADVGPVLLRRLNREQLLAEAAPERRETVIAALRKGVLPEALLQTLAKHAYIETGRSSTPASLPEPGWIPPDHPLPRESAAHKASAHAGALYLVSAPARVVCPSSHTSRKRPVSEMLF